MKLELNQFKIVAKESHTAQIIITALALRERLSHTTTLNRFRTSLKAQGERIDDKEFDAFWVNLENAGVGRLLLNKDKNLNKFEWFYSLKDLCKFALGEKNSINKLVKSNDMPVKTVALPQDFVEQNKDKLLYVALEDGTLCKLEITGKLTDKDALRIVKAIKGVSL